MRVLAFVPSGYDISPGQRYRIEQWEPYLRERGVEITYLPFETPELRNILYGKGDSVGKARAVLSGLKRRSREVKTVRDYDLVYVFREAALLGPAWFERRIAASGIPMVFDFDDAVFVPYVSPSNGYLSYLKFPGKTETIIRLSAHVMAGNSYLAEYAGRYNPNVTIIPTTIDTEAYRAPGESGNDVPVIGWTGSFSTVQHLDTIRETLQELAKRHRFKLRVIGTDSYSLPGVETEVFRWRPETEIDDLRAMDVGIMPLPDDRWARGKCGLKALQYMALGRPAVCSPVGVNSEIVQDGVNGMLAASADEWIAKLSRLLEDTSFRTKLGEAARTTVVERYSAAVQAPRVFEVFEKAIAEKSREKNGNT